MRPLTAGLVYFVLVFGAGFVLGPFRILWLAPRVGERTAELMETPVMLAVTFLAARFVARRLAAPRTPARLLGIGGLALMLLLLSESGLVLWLRGMTIRDYVAHRDPVSGTVYLVTLALFAVMPWLLSRRAGHAAPPPV